MLRELSEKNKKILLRYMHKEINETTQSVVKSILNGNIEEQITYPPDTRLTDEEIESMRQVKNISSIESALIKIILDACANPIFSLFSVIDGVTDPDDCNWKGVSILDRVDSDKDVEEFLHDSFYDSYWDFKEE
ncbi:hypothetical protein [Clostridium estertheticum]|uniref:hypothetical protein n=1 Tax=Clostridium estertheticum TaxID=238834 RepID=UPI001CF356D5|nr:hypothetical protein [Clostridium estertheticum]MCB2362400.1 hypothetical protein [Clostridium estertheticum]